MKGVRVEVAFGEYVVPPISLRMDYDYETERDIIADQNANPKDWNRAAIKFVLGILRRNYPDLTEDQFFETASASDLGPLLMAARTQSGYTQGPLVARPNESPAASSSDTSSTPPAGSLTTSSTG